MTNDERNPKLECPIASELCPFRHSGFRHSGFRHSSFGFEIHGSWVALFRFAPASWPFKARIAPGLVALLETLRPAQGPGFGGLFGQPLVELLLRNDSQRGLHGIVAVAAELGASDLVIPDSGRSEPGGNAQTRD